MCSKKVLPKVNRPWEKGSIDSENLLALSRELSANSAHSLYLKRMMSLLMMSLLLTLRDVARLPHHAGRFL